MELKEYLLIFRKNKKLFFGTAGTIIFIFAAYLLWRPVAFGVAMNLNITRSGTQNSDAYKYDDFYRLQADEKFAETVVEWLKSPRVEEDIYADAGIDTTDYSLKRLSGSLMAEKRSSQVVAVAFSVPDRKIAEKISASIPKIVSRNIQSLDQDQQDPTWFEIVPQSPVIRQQEVSTLLVAAALLLSVFLAFFAVMFKHYLE